MSYREENGQVILTMSREDYEFLLMVCRENIVIYARQPSGNNMRRNVEFVNSLNLR